MEDGLIVNIGNSTLKDINHIIETVVGKYASEVTDVAALAWTLQTLMTAKDELKNR